jgi:Transposase DDE domain
MTKPMSLNRENAMPRARRSRLDRAHAASLIEVVFEEQNLHVKRVESLVNGVVGTLRTSRLSIHAIGQAYAELATIGAKHGVKQIDRFLSNPAFDVWKLLESWAKFVIGGRGEIVIALDWTDFELDDHTTLAAYVVTRHGRATPLAWKTVLKSKLKGKRIGHERAFIQSLAQALPRNLGVTLIADRGFADQTLYGELDTLGWDYVVRFKDNVFVEHQGAQKQARQYVPASGRATMLHNVRLTGKRTLVKAIVLVHAKKMKEAWCLVTSLSTRLASEVVKLYGKRFTIEETFRDQKDLRFGLGLRATHIHNAQRRDRLLLLTAIAHALLTLLGAASEATGLDRTLKVNTSPNRMHSLFRQGAYWYNAIPNMRDDWFHLLMTAFDRIVSEHTIFCEVFTAI